MGNYVSSELVANLDILVCTVALMGLDVGATLGELLVGGCTGLWFCGLGSGKAMFIFSWAGFGGRVAC